MNTLRDVIIGFVTIVVGHLLGATFSEEIRHRLERAPRWMLRLATRGAERDLRDELRRDLEAELEHIFHESEGLPITRFLRGGRFAFSLLLAAPKLNGRRTWIGTTIRLGLQISGLTVAALESLGFWNDRHQVAMAWSNLSDYGPHLLMWQNTFGGIFVFCYTFWYFGSVCWGIVLVLLSSVPEGRWRRFELPIRLLRALWITSLALACVTAVGNFIYYYSYDESFYSDGILYLRRTLIAWLIFTVIYVAGKNGFNAAIHAAAKRKKANA
jgi:hypothetical protein